MVGVDEPDLAAIQPGVQRSVAEKILGERLWHVGLSEGLVYDIYQYETKKPSQPVLGLIGYGMDFLTFGSMELMDDPRNFGRAEQVAVAYDNRDRVAFVSRPWPVCGLGPCRRQRHLIPEDAGVPATTRPGPLQGLSGPASNTAILEDKDLDVETIDGRVPEEDVIELQPGRYELKHHGYVETVEFYPGRHYRMQHESFYGFARYRPFYFIEDVDSKETQHCVSPL